MYAAYVAALFTALILAATFQLSTPRGDRTAKVVAGVGDQSGLRRSLGLAPLLAAELARIHQAGVRFGQANPGHVGEITRSGWRPFLSPELQPIGSYRLHRAPDGRISAWMIDQPGVPPALVAAETARLTGAPGAGRAEGGTVQSVLFGPTITIPPAAGVPENAAVVVSS